MIFSCFFGDFLEELLKKLHPYFLKRFNVLEHQKCELLTHSSGLFNKIRF